MIASHNTFSYLQPRHKIFNFFKGFWRCQDLDIKEQLASGVEYLDVRVRYTFDCKARLCHGFVDYGKEYDSLAELVEEKSLKIIVLLLLLMYTFCMLITMRTISLRPSFR